jgi:hypothetical protein
VIKNRASLSMNWDFEEDRLPTGLWDVEAPTISRQLAHISRWDCQPYALASLHPQEDSWNSFLLESELTPGPYCGWKH